MRRMIHILLSGNTSQEDAPEWNIESNRRLPSGFAKRRVRMVRILSGILLFGQLICIMACSDTPENKFVESAKWGDLDAVSSSLSSGMNPDATNAHGHTALMMAASMGHIDIVKLLLKKGANVNARDEEGKTPLMYAAERGQTDVAQILLSKGADIHAKSEAGETALGLALKQPSKDLITVLRMAGARE